MILIENNKEKINELCKNHNVKKLYLFGSATGRNFNENSDIDFLVRFKPIDLAKYFENYMALKDKLRSLFRRDIDLVEEQTLKNPILIQSINNSKELIYG